MISEPEMSDEAGGGLAGDVLSGAGDPGGGTVPVHRARPWLWAVGGVVVASAVWAAVLHGTGGSGPDLHGYRLDGNPCSGDALKPLEHAVGVRDFVASDATVSKGPALDRLSCMLTTGSSADDGWATSYSISVGIELHKKTDPRAEFDNDHRSRVSTLPGSATGGNTLIAIAGDGFTSAADVRPVTGVGDEAYLVSPRAPAQTLEVLHGGAVLSIQVSGYTQWNSTDDSAASPGGSPKEPDLTRLRPALTAAMRQLMTSLSS